jgi:transcriptional regulator GlxA family with amidase domain
MRTVLIVLFDRVQSLDVTGPLEVFAGTNCWQSRRDHSPESTNGPDGPAYRIRTASLGARPVRTSSGLRLTPDHDLAAVARPDVLPGPCARRDRQRHARPQPLHPHRPLHLTTSQPPKPQASHFCGCFGLRGGSGQLQLPGFTM